MKHMLLVMLFAVAGLISGCASFKSPSGREATFEKSKDGVKGSYKDPFGYEAEFDTNPQG